MIIVTLTTIPCRVEYLQRVIDNILNQSVKPDRIILYVPREYEKRSLGKVDFNNLPHGCDIIYCNQDYGPATKILPALQEYKDQDVSLIYCDDDRIYEKNWIKRLTEKSKQYPRDCIIDEGYNMDFVLFKLWQSKHRIKYKLLRFLSLGLYAPKRKMKNREHHDIGEGFGGVLVKPDFFPPEVFDIPDILWSVDDTWLSGMMHKNGINIRKTDRARKERSRSVNITNDEPLNLYVYKGHNREGAISLCVKYFIDNYRIWEQYKDLCNLK